MEVIDLSGPHGNVFYIMGRAKVVAMDKGINPVPILEDMRSGDYDHTLDVVEKELGEHICFTRR